MKKIFKLIGISLLFFSCDGIEKVTPLNEFELLERANNHYQQNRYLDAKLCFDTLISLNPLKGEYLYKRGYSKAMLLNDDKGAKEDFIKAIEYNYENKKAAYLNVGTIHRIAGDYDTAIFFYNKALELDTNYEKAKKEKKEVLEILEKRQNKNKDIKESKEVFL